MNKRRLLIIAVAFIIAAPLAVLYFYPHKTKPSKSIDDLIYLHRTPIFRPTFRALAFHLGVLLREKAPNANIIFLYRHNEIVRWDFFYQVFKEKYMGKPNNVKLVLIGEDFNLKTSLAPYIQSEKINIVISCFAFTPKEFIDQVNKDTTIKYLLIFCNEIYINKKYRDLIKNDIILNIFYWYKYNNTEISEEDWYKKLEFSQGNIELDDRLAEVFTNDDFTNINKNNISNYPLKKRVYGQKKPRKTRAQTSRQ